MAIEAYVADLFARVGPVADLYAVDVYENENLWHVAVDERAVVFAEWSAERRIVVLSADLGAPREESRARFHELALRYNDAWTESGGLRLALDGAGAATLLLDWVPARGAERELGSLLHRFAIAAAAWREALQRPPTAMPSGLSDSDFQMIRI